MTTGTSETTKLRDEDFLRLGVAVSECRSTVIRRAALKSSQSLAEQLLQQPEQGSEQQLVQLVTSTYRLLDPRQRLDTGQRNYVGRILPLALMAAARPRSARTPFSGAPQTETEWEQEATQWVSQPSPGVGATIPQIDTERHRWHASLGSQDLLTRRRRSRLNRLRRLFRTPQVLLSLIGLTLATAAGLAIWASNHSPSHPLRSGAQAVHAGPQQRN